MDPKPLALLLRLAAVYVGVTHGHSILAAERREPRTPGRRDVSRNGAVALPDYMLSLYQTLSTLRRGDRVSRASSAFTNTVTSFVDQGQDHPWESGQRYVFDLSRLTPTTDVAEAQLRILRKPPPVDFRAAGATGGNVSSNILLYSCAPEATSGRRTLLASRAAVVLEGALPRWEVFDVGDSVRARHAGAEDRTRVCFHLLVTSGLTEELADPLVLGLGRHTRLPREKALLVAFSRTSKDDSLLERVMEEMRTAGGDVTSAGCPNKHRLRRGTTATASNHSSGGSDAVGARSKRARCGRKPMRVNFRELGWDDWIIAPLEYEAHRCDGTCEFPLRAHLEPTNHAVIQMLVHSTDPGASPASCCVPVAMSAVDVLHVDAGSNVVYRRYEDMVVERCGCR